MSEVVVMETSMGNFEIELNREKAPITVENFIKYVNEGFYDGLIFHRVIKNFMVQGGGFTPNGNQKETHDEIKLESNNGLKNNKGTVAMARTNVPDSATSQFFINVVNNDFLNYALGNDGYAVFGEVISGMDIVEKIKAVQTSTKNGMGDWPVEDVLITKAYLKE
ncbi:peptidyl-prolyl cis-trans isomerase [Candidatus Woesearchaeota archaeon]|nr:peptidyl-prolyl cis-trans isomerase [Candidatus Woesearchaeota archaeon]